MLDLVIVSYWIKNLEDIIPLIGRCNPKIEGK